MKTDRRGFLGGLVALAVVPRACVPEPVAAWNGIAHLVTAPNISMLSPPSTSASLAAALNRLYTRPWEQAFAAHERSMAKFYEDILGRE